MDGIKLLNTQEMADVLGIGKQTLIKLSQEGAIPFVKLGERTFRYDREKVIAAMAVEQTTEPDTTDT